MKKLLKKYNLEMLPTIFSLAWPTMVEQFMGTAVQYVDTAMVGNLGTLAMASVGATSTVNWLVGSTVSALGVGYLAFISQAFGAKEYDKAKRASGQAVMTTCIVGILFTIICCSLYKKVPQWMQVDTSIRDMASRYFFIIYAPMLFRSSTIILGTILRSVGDTKTPMKVGIISNLINVVLNYILIYTCGLGVIGAAIATAISYIYGGIAIFLKVMKHPQISFIGVSLKPDMEILRPCFKVAFPNMLQRFGTSLGYVAFASMINALGDVSTAAHTIANTVESAFYIPGWGMQTAAATLAGNSLGMKDEARLKSVARTMIPLEVGLMVISGGLLFIFAPQLMHIFSSDDVVIGLGSTVLRMVAISEPFYGVPIVIEGMMQGVGKTVPPFIFNILGMWCVRILGTFICTTMLGYGLISAWACMIGHNMLLCVLFLTTYLLDKWHPSFDTL